MFTACSKYLVGTTVKVFFGGISVKLHKDLLAKETPHVVIGTPGRILQLGKEKSLKLNNLKRFVLDECDQMLESLGTPLSVVFSLYDPSPFSLCLFL